MMTSESLMAIISVDETWALARKPNPWKMPSYPLYTDLELRTRGRILRTDCGFSTPSLDNSRVGRVAK